MNNDKIIKAVAFGEILWDVFEDQKKIGGAPLNVALRMKSLNCDVSMISCVGRDENGIEILNKVESLEIKTDTIFQSEIYPTGLVKVTLDESGSASYDIHYPSAWDKIKINDFTSNLVNNADVLVYGSLVCRDEVSRKSLELLLQSDVYKVFDVNLRKPHYTYDVLEKLMAKADFIKFNDEELLEISKALRSPYTTIEKNIEFITSRTKAQTICVTRGKDGAILFLNGEMYESEGYSVQVIDTVGAGDSFLATLVTCLLKGKEPQVSINYACAMGALVAASPGANPEIHFSEVENLILNK